MATFLLRWNPAISSVTEDGFRRMVEHFPFCEMDWSVHDFAQADQGDTFYMMRVGDDRPGIVMRGVFSSTPKRAADWAKEGKVRFYCDLRIDYIMDVHHDPYISLTQLEKRYPEMDWNHGHSGVLLSKEEEHALDALWSDFRKKHTDFLETLDVKDNRAIDPLAIPRIENFQVYRDIFDWVESEEDLISLNRVHDCANIDFHIDYNNSEATVKVWMQGDEMLVVTCRKLYRVKCDLEKGSTAFDWFRISGEYTDALHVQANGIDIFCQDVSFSKEEYSDDLIPVSI